MSIFVEAYDGERFIETLTDRPIRKMPNGAYGIVYRKKVYTILADSKKFYIDNKMEYFEKLDCPIVDVELDLKNENPAQDEKNHNDTFKPPIIDRLPSMDLDELAALFQNCKKYVDSSGKEIDTSASKQIIAAVRSEWKSRGGAYDPAEDAFILPKTNALAGDGSLSEDGWRRVGFLGYLGYSVGATSELSITARHRLLALAFRVEVPTVFPSDYRSAWGPTTSCKRLQKIANSIATFARNAKLAGGKPMAVSDWESDLKHLKKKYFLPYRCAFKWPTLDEYISGRI